MKLSTFVLLVSCFNLTASDRRLLDACEFREYMVASKRLMNLIASKAKTMEEYESLLNDVQQEAGKKLRLVSPIELRTKQGSVLLPTLLVEASNCKDIFPDGRIVDVDSLGEQIPTWKMCADPQTISSLERLCRGEILSYSSEHGNLRALARNLSVINFLSLDKLINNLDFDFLSALTKIPELMRDELNESEIEVITKKLEMSCHMFDVNLQSSDSDQTLNACRLIPIGDHKILGTFDTRIFDTSRGEHFLGVLNLENGLIEIRLEGDFGDLVQLDDKIFCVREGFGARQTRKKITIEEGIIKVDEFPDFDYLFKRDDGFVLFSANEENHYEILLTDKDGNIIKKFDLSYSSNAAPLQVDNDRIIFAQRCRLHSSSIQQQPTDSTKLYELNLKDDSVTEIYSKEEEENTGWNHRGNYLRSVTKLSDANLLLLYDSDVEIFNKKKSEGAQFDINVGLFPKAKVLDDTHFVLFGWGGIKIVTFRLEDDICILEKIDPIISSNGLVGGVIDPDNVYYSVVTKQNKVVRIPIWPGVSFNTFNLQLAKSKKQQAASSSKS